VRIQRASRTSTKQPNRIRDCREGKESISACAIRRVYCRRNSRLLTYDSLDGYSWIGGREIMIRGKHPHHPGNRLQTRAPPPFSGINSRLPNFRRQKVNKSLDPSIPQLTHHQNAQTQRKRKRCRRRESAGLHVQAEPRSQEEPSPQRRCRLVCAGRMRRFSPRHCATKSHPRQRQSPARERGRWAEQATGIP
jgi:hypothetical protein